MYVCCIYSHYPILPLYEDILTYCTVMNWERSLASWRYSTKLLVYGVGISGLLHVVFILAILPSLEFFPKNPPPILWRPKVVDGEIQWTGSRNGEVIYTSEIMPRNAPFSRPKLDPSPRDGMHITFGEWFAPLGDISGWILLSLVMVLSFFHVWATIHILMSLSRMYHAAEEITPKM